MSTMSLVPNHLTTTEAAVILACDTSTVCRYVRKRLLPHKRLGNNILIPEKAVAEFEKPLPGNPHFRRNSL
jgi:excisionase family DNA binding protein